MGKDIIYLGVPCSAAGDKQSVIPCTREDEAIAIAVGFHLCGIKNVRVFMQNSGYGHCLDAITSLLMPYGIKIPIEVYPGADVPQHQPMNKLFKRIKL